MNFFYLEKTPTACAASHCDKHFKMIVEYAQMLSTAHRVLDGHCTIAKSKTGRNVKRWELQDIREEILYKATHVNHMTCVWSRETSENYRFMYDTMIALGDEYEKYSGRAHATIKLLAHVLNRLPDSIRVGSFTPPPQCMPDTYKATDAIEAYRSFYVHDKSRFAKWKTGRPVPDWYSPQVSLR